MRKYRHAIPAKHVTLAAICTALVGVVAGAVTYAFMSGAIEALQYETPHPWTMAVMLIITIPGSFILGWKMKKWEDEEIVRAHRRSVIDMTHWTSNRPKSRQRQARPNEWSDTA